MDKQTVSGFILIALVLMVWMWWSSPRPSQQLLESKQATEQRKDSILAAKPPVPAKAAESNTEPQDLSPRDSLGKFFAHCAVGREEIITIETDLYTAEISTKGGVIRKFELKNYKTWDQRAVQLVENSTAGDFSLLFSTTDGKLVNTKGLFFDAVVPPGGTVFLRGEDELLS